MRTIKSFSQLTIGFSWKGLAVFLLPMLPNILFFIFDDTNKVNPVTHHHPYLDIIEHGSQGIFAALLIILVSKKEVPLRSMYTQYLLLLLLTNFGLWAIYFSVDANFIMLMLMAIIPTVYFVIAEIWLHNLPAIIFTVIFGATHIVITYFDFG